MENLNYIWSKKGVHVSIALIISICLFYRFFIFNEQLIKYLAGINFNFTFIIFPIFFYYLLNLYHQYIDNTFVKIRYTNIEKQKVIDETLLVTSYALCLCIIQILPCLFQIKIELVYYCLDIALFNFSLFLLMTHLIEIISESFKFQNVVSFFAVLEGAFYFFILYSGRINISPLICYPNQRTIFSMTCITISYCLSYYRMRDFHV